jgi:hypothetical protein
MSHSTFVRDCELIYEHLAILRKTVAQDELLAHFRALFIIGKTYPNPEILAAVHRIVVSRWAPTKFPLFLNRCCYILINYWWTHADFRLGTSQLATLLTSSPMVERPSLAISRLHQLRQQFTETEWFAGIQARARAEQDLNLQSSQSRRNQTRRNQMRPDLSGSAEPLALREEIYRYPFLYPHLLTSWDSSEEGQSAVQKLQLQREQQFEEDLYRYCLDSKRGSLEGLRGNSLGKNPTLLEDSHLAKALAHYAGKAHQGRTILELANSTRQTMLQANSVRDAKQQMHRYLVELVDPKYSQHRFGTWLADQLSGTWSQGDRHIPQPNLLVQVCSQLINVLLSPPAHNQANHMMLIDFNNNVGANSTIGLILQVILVCRGLMRDKWNMIKALVARRFAQLCQHYQALSNDQSEWLVYCLEHLQVAFTVHAERRDFAWFA